jgi:hypothetical protein
MVHVYNAQGEYFQDQIYKLPALKFVIKDLQPMAQRAA